VNTCTAYTQSDTKNRGKTKTVFGQLSKLMQISFPLKLERIRHVSTRRQAVTVMAVVMVMVVVVVMIVVVIIRVVVW
jgi:hypothetical protein